MKLSLDKTYLILLIVTTAVVILSYFQFSTIAWLCIIVFSVLKFILVGFEFMELKQAHPFWKVLFLGYSILMGLIFIGCLF